MSPPAFLQVLEALEPRRGSPPTAQGPGSPLRNIIIYIKFMETPGIDPPCKKLKRLGGGFEWNPLISTNKLKSKDPTQWQFKANGSTRGNLYQAYPLL